MLITLMVSAVARKSRTFSSLPCSATEQVCRSWEGAQPGSQLKVPNGNITCHRHHAHFINGGWTGGRDLLFASSMSLNPLVFKSSNFSGNLVFFGSFVKCPKSAGLGLHYGCSGTDCELVIGW